MAEVERRLEVLERPLRPSVPRYTADPANPEEGWVWVNTATNQLKVRYNGVTHGMTLS
jgi:hypothetical protein